MGEQQQQQQQQGKSPFLLFSGSPAKWQNQVEVEEADHVAVLVPVLVLVWWYKGGVLRERSSN
jgi:hypothetical protein